MNHRWRFMINQFLVATFKNYKKAYKLSREHDMRLKKRMDENPGDADYTLAYNRYHVYHLALEAAYTNWRSKGGIQKGETLTLDQLLTLLPGKINKIDVKIQDIHEKGSERYVQLFPNAHKPFYMGTQDTKITAVEALILTMGSEVALAPVKALTEVIYNDLIAAKDDQTGAKQTTETASSAVELARIKAMTGQYQNVGFFINKFPDQPDMIEPLFDVATLTNPEQTIWKGHLDPLENHPTLIHTFEAGDMLRFKSNGDAPVSAFLASTPGGTDSTEIKVEPMQENIIDVTAFGVTDYSVHRYLTLVNTSSTLDTRYVVELY